MFSFLLQLDEFRKKKAAERAKKAATNSLVPNSDSLNGKQHSENEHVRVNELNGVSTSDGIGGAVIDTSTAGMSNDANLNLLNQSSNQGSLTGRTSPARNDLNSLSTTLMERHDNIDEINRYNVSGRTGSLDFSQRNEENQLNDMYKTYSGGFGGVSYGSSNSERKMFDNSTNQSSLHGMNHTHANKSDGSLKDYTVTNQGSYFPSRITPQNSVDSIPQVKPTNSSNSESGSLHGSPYGGNLFFFGLISASVVFI